MARQRRESLTRQRTISAAAPCMPANLGTAASTLSRAQNAMSSSSPGVHSVRALRPVERGWIASGDHLRRHRGVRPRAVEQLHVPAGAAGVVQRERALVAGTEHRHVLAPLAGSARRPPRGSACCRAAPRRSARRPAPIVRVPFVVERISVLALRLEDSRGEAPTSKPSISDRVPLAADDAPPAAPRAAPVPASISATQRTRS